MHDGAATLFGSCLCGRVRYRIDAAPSELVFCHCSRCRKATGSAFQSVAPMDRSAFVLLEGQESLGEFESSPGVHRVFCRDCGSPLYSRRDAMPELLRLRVGTLDTPLPDVTRSHIFVASKADWHDIRDDAPQHATRPGE